VQLYRYFVSQSSEFFRHNPLRCFLTNVYGCCSLSTQSGNFLIRLRIICYVSITKFASVLYLYIFLSTTSNQNATESSYCQNAELLSFLYFVKYSQHRKTFRTELWRLMLSIFRIMNKDLCD